MTILISVIIGIFIGSSVGLIIGVMFKRTNSYVGVMKIIREDGKYVYSLELNEDPIELAYRDEIIFKVETSEESS